MKAYAVLRAVRELALADATLAGIYGTTIRLQGQGDHQVPSLNILLIADGIVEQWQPVSVQFSQFTVSFSELRESEAQLLRLFHPALPTTVLGGMPMWAEYLDGGDLTVPSRDGYFGRAVRFRLTPLREQYQPSPYP